MISPTKIPIFVIAFPFMLITAAIMVTFGLAVYISCILGIAIASPFIILLSNDKAALSNAFDWPTNFLRRTLDQIREIWGKWVDAFR
jgi:hypothetical protein